MIKGLKPLRLFRTYRCSFFTGLTQLAQGEEAFLRHLTKRGVTSERPDVSVVQLNNLIAIRV